MAKTAFTWVSWVKATPGIKPMSAAVRDLFREPLVPNEMKHFDAVVVGAGPHVRVESAEGKGTVFYFKLKAGGSADSTR